MNLAVLAGVIGMFLGWGVWGIAAKLAIKQIGLQLLVWVQLANLALIPLYFIMFKELLPLRLDAAGIGWALLAGALGALGTVSLYLTLGAAPASVVIPLSSLYPIVTVVLAYIFLQEELSPMRLLGVGCALAAVWLLTT